MTASNDTNPRKLNLSVDMRIIVLVLVAIIVTMLIIWKPWSAVSSDSRTVTVSGTATVKAAPDEFVFYPTYEFDGADKEAALKNVTTKSDELTKKLKELGVAEADIKTNADGTDFPYYYRDGSTDETTYTLRLTVTVDNRDLAQKVQDYLVTTAPTGQISPYATFSEAKRKTLESQARDEATKDARAKADQSAKNLGFKVAKVKTIEDGANFGAIPYASGIAEDTKTSSDSSASLTIQPGENELTYSVSVVYYIR